MEALSECVDALIEHHLSVPGARFAGLKACAGIHTGKVFTARGFLPTEDVDFAALGRGEEIPTHVAASSLMALESYRLRSEDQALPDAVRTRAAAICGLLRMATVAEVSAGDDLLGLGEDGAGGDTAAAAREAAREQQRLKDMGSWASRQGL